MSIQPDSITNRPTRSSAMLALGFDGSIVPRPAEDHPPIERPTLPPVIDNALIREVERVCK